MKKLITTKKEVSFCDVEGCENGADDSWKGKKFFLDFCYTHKPIFELAYQVAQNSLEQKQGDKRNELAKSLFDMILKEYNAKMDEYKKGKI